MRVILAKPRGFCAGVERAIEIVERALEIYGPPVYVRHEIVHNKRVVEDLKAKGARFVEELDEIPDGAVTVFSAHGVSQKVEDVARLRALPVVDATCPLVAKVHKEGQRYAEQGFEVVLIGHEGHPEVEGTMGRIPGKVYLVSTAEAVGKLEVGNPDKLAYVSQTTLSVDDTAEIVSALKDRFPDIVAPKKEDICYATTNRQEAVKAIARHCDAIVVVGAPNSSNSMRLVEVAAKEGSKAFLVQRAKDIDWDRLGGMKTIGITAGASAPEILVQEVLKAFRERFNVSIEEVRTTDENIQFKLPAALTA